LRGGILIDFVKKIVKFLINYENYRNLIIKEFIWAISGKITPVIAVDAGSMRLFVYTKDKFVGKDIFIHGVSREDKFNKAMAALKKTGRNNMGPILVDVGANIGSTSIFALFKFGFRKAMAFEPAPDNVALLRCNVMINRLKGAIDIYPIAISDNQGSVELQLSEANFGGHQVCSKNLKEPKGRTITVPCDTLDNVLSKNVISDVGLIWIDAEGHEGHILRGAEKILKAGIPVVAEFCPYTLRDAGGLEDFLCLTKKYFNFFLDLKGDSRESRLMPVVKIDELLTKYTEARFTDLLLLK
jgi:FkbM family methyltransferase